METNVAKPRTSSHSVCEDTEDLYDFKRQLKLKLESEGAKTNSNSLEKKKSKRDKGKSIKKGITSSGRRCRSVGVLYDCDLEDLAVVDEESEILKCNRKNKIDKFLNGYEKMMKDYGHCNKDDDKLDGSVKAHYRRFSCVLTLQSM